MARTRTSTAHRDDTALVGDESPTSKTRRKQQMHELQALGKRLIPLSPERLAALPLAERLRDAILAARRIRDHEGLRRQVQFIGKLMRDADADAIRTALDADSLASRAQTGLLHACEHWREALLENPQALAEFVARHRPDEDLAPLIAAVHAERERGLAPAAYRKLFRAIHRALAPDATADGDDDKEPRS